MSFFSSFDPTLESSADRRFRELAQLSELGSLIERYGSDPLRELYAACMAGPEAWDSVKDRISIPTTH